MALYIPQQWGSEDTLDLHQYATKIELLNYLRKEANGSVDMNGEKLSGLAEPVNSGDAVSKWYVDENLMERVAKAGGSIMSGVINMNGHRILNIPLPTDDGDAVSKSYVLPKSGGAMSGEIDMGGSRITNLASPTAAGDVATKEYADKKLSNPPMETLDMASYRIANVGYPRETNDAVPLRYLDGLIAKHMICITGEAVGAIAAGSSNFSFGANSFKYSNAAGGQNSNSGVTVPVSGKIKYFTVCSTNSSGNPVPQHTGLQFSIIISGNITSPLATIARDSRSVTKTFERPIEVSAGDRINFFSRTASPFSFITIASVFIELDI